MDKNLLKYILLVLLGAASYGTLATIVKLAYRDGYTVNDVLLSQYILGTLVMLFLYFLVKKAGHTENVQSSRKNKWLLVLGGSTYGMTGYFYYLSLQYIPVSVAVVLLMQTVWMGVVAESIQHRELPSGIKVVAIIVILLGTIFATNAIAELRHLNTKGVFWGLCAASAYTVALYISKNNKSKLGSISKSLMILVGSTIFILFIGLFTINKPLNVSIFWKWGLFLALFGAILPPILLNKGMPKLGIGLGALLISIEIPVSLLMAEFILNEKHDLYQWVGVIFILLSIFLINYPRPKTIRS